jgi:FtsP/CotA-like multicopper oxidase with cupredoxin domain
LTFEIVATDGRPMPTPIAAGTWEIGPGERYDLLVSGTQVGQYIAQIDYLDDYTGAVLGSARTRVEIV